MNSRVLLLHPFLCVFTLDRHSECNLALV